MGGKLLRAAVVLLALAGAWQLVVWISGVPPFILPGPLSVAEAIGAHAGTLAANAWVTFAEIGLGLVLGGVLGIVSALTLAYFRPARLWLLPVLVASQAVPVFALVPLLVLWLGYGMVSKIAMATLIIYFPVVAAFFDGLRRTEPGWLDLAQTMNASPWRTLRHIRFPAALPALASGLRVATAVAPIGTIVGEWVGASRGLGYLMLHANARMQIDLLFAALTVLAVFAVLLYAGVDAGLRRALPWQADSLPEPE